MIKMKVSNDIDSICEECECGYRDTQEMYRLMMCGRVFNLCFDCVNVLFDKTLKAGCRYNAKVKTKEDQIRMERARNRRQNNAGAQGKEA